MGGGMVWREEGVNRERVWDERGPVAVGPFHNGFRQSLCFLDFVLNLEGVVE